MKKAISKGQMLVNAAYALFCIVPGYYIFTQTYDLKTAHTVIKLLEGGIVITVVLSTMCVYVRDGLYKLKVVQWLNKAISEGYITKDYKAVMKELDEIE